MKLFLILLFNFFYITLCNVYITLNNKNHIHITTQIDSETRIQLINDTQRLDAEEIYLYIDSPGGQVFEGNKIIEYIHYMENTGHNISCIAQSAYSMAFTIFQHCPVRYVTNTASLMQHQMSLALFDSLEHINGYISMINQVNQDNLLYLSDKLDMELLDLKEKINNDWWIYGEDIFKYKLADSYATVGCDVQLLQENKCPLVN